MRDLKKAVAIISKFEGYRPEAYQDAVGVWTIGYGTTKYPDGTKVKKGDRTSVQQAKNYLLDYIKKDAKKIEGMFGPKLNENQFNALVSFAYNVGIGWVTTKGSVYKNLYRGDLKEAGRCMLKYDKVRKKKWFFTYWKRLPGLTKRRRAELNLYNAL